MKVPGSDSRRPPKIRERVQISGGNPMIGIGTDQFPDCSESVCVGWALSAVPIPMRSVPI